MSGSPRQRGYALARQIARHLADAGEDPYADECEQYLILEEGARAGETIEFGKPLRGHRLFAVKTRARTHRLAGGTQWTISGERKRLWICWRRVRSAPNCLT